jgi:parallel beta-helix repeat protein
MLVSISFLTSICGISVVSSVVSAEGEDSVALISSPVIQVNNDAELASLISANGWQGNGTLSNPFVIENLDIDAARMGDAILVGNTTSHLVIRNCNLHSDDGNPLPYGSGGGITLFDVTNVVLENNVCTGKSYGIILRSVSYANSRNNTISNNTCIGNVGIELGRASFNDVFNNTIIGKSGSGLNLLGSDNNSISNNTCYGNDGGIYLTSSDHNVISNNTGIGNGLEVDSNNGFGLSLVSSNNNTVSNNTCNGKDCGLHLFFSNNNTISDNNCNGKNYGLLLVDGKDNRIVGNEGTLSVMTGRPDDRSEILPVFVISAIMFALVTVYLMWGRKKRSPRR